jgi:hypothetical protein
MGSAHLVYNLLCDDVRLEAGNKLSFMGVFENVFFPSFPSILLKFAIVSHWEGSGQFEIQVRILSPDGREMAISVPSKFSIDSQGYADNITFFTNVAFERPGAYLIQILIDNRVVAEKRMYVHHVSAVSPIPNLPGSSTVH